MIEEEAYVAEVGEGRVWVEKTRQSACSSCAESCPSALAGGLFGGKPVRLQVSSDLPLRPGDKVLIGIAEDTLAKGAFWIYLLPLLCLFAGALLGKSITGSDSASALAGLAGLGLSYAGLKAFRLFDRAGYDPVVLRKIN